MDTGAPKIPGGWGSWLQEEANWNWLKESARGAASTRGVDSTAADDLQQETCRRLLEAPTGPEKLMGGEGQRKAYVMAALLSVCSDARKKQNRHRRRHVEDSEFVATWPGASSCEAVEQRTKELLDRKRNAVWRAILQVVDASIETSGTQPEQHARSILVAVLRVCGVSLTKIARQFDIPAGESPVTLGHRLNDRSARLLLDRIREAVRDALSETMADDPQLAATPNPLRDSKHVKAALKHLGIRSGPLNLLLREFVALRLLAVCQQGARVFAAASGLFHVGVLLVSASLVAATPHNVPRLVFPHVWLYFAAFLFTVYVSIRRWQVSFASARVRLARSGLDPRTAPAAFLREVWNSPGSAVVAVVSLLAIWAGLDAIEYGRFAWSGTAALESAGWRPTADSSLGAVMIWLDMAAYLAIALAAQACLDPNRHSRRVYFGVSLFAVIACLYWLIAWSLPAGHEFVILVERVWQPAVWFKELTPTKNVAVLVLMEFGVTAVVAAVLGLLRPPRWRLTAWLLGLVVVFFAFGSSFTSRGLLAPERLLIVVPISSLMVLRLLSLLFGPSRRRDSVADRE